VLEPNCDCVKPVADIPVQHNTKELQRKIGLLPWLRPSDAKLFRKIKLLVDVELGHFPLEEKLQREKNKSMSRLV